MARTTVTSLRAGLQEAKAALRKKKDSSPRGWAEGLTAEGRERHGALLRDLHARMEALGQPCEVPTAADWLRALVHDAEAREVLAKLAELPRERHQAFPEWEPDGDVAGPEPAAPAPGEPSLSPGADPAPAPAPPLCPNVFDVQTEADVRPSWGAEIFGPAPVPCAPPRMWP